MDCDYKKDGCFSLDKKNGKPNVNAKLCRSAKGLLIVALTEYTI